LDILNSLASLIHFDVQGTDSKNLLDTFLGKSDKSRANIVLEATSRTAYREGDWVMIPPYEGPSVERKVNIELGNSDGYLLYNLAVDPSQQSSLTQKEPEKLRMLIENFESIRGTGYGNIQLLELK
jgi:hypothetical protein